MIKQVGLPNDPAFERHHKAGHAATTLDFDIASIRAPEPLLELPGDFPPDTVSFAVRTCVALVLGYYVAFAFELRTPFTVGLVVPLIMQAQQGATLSKSGYYVTATVAAGFVAILMASAFAQDRTMLIMSYAIWLGVCAFVASLLKGFRSYGMAVAGFTVAIIAVIDIDNPQDVALRAIDRSAGVLIGIICVAVVNNIFDGPGAWLSLTPKLRKSINDTAEYAIKALRGDPAPATGLAGAEDAAGILALRSEADYVAHEFQDGKARAEGARSAIAAMLGMVSAGRAVSHAQQKVKPDAETQIAVERAIEELRRPGYTNASAYLAQAVEKAETLPQAFLLDRTRVLIEYHTAALDGLASLVSGNPPAQKARLCVYYDVPGALFNALRAMIATALGALFCIYAGWSGATLLLVMISAYTTNLSTAPNPTKAALGLAVLAPIALLAAGLTKFLLLPHGSSFIVVALAILPFAFISSVVTRRIGMGANVMLLIYATGMQLSNPQSYDFASFLNIAMEMYGAILATIVAFVLVFPISLSRRRFRLLEIVARSLRQALRGERRLKPTELLSLQYDRVATALASLGSRIPVRLAFLTQLRDLAELDTVLGRAHTALDAAEHDEVAIAATVIKARAALVASSIEEIAAAADELFADADNGATRSAATSFYGVTLLMQKQNRLLGRLRHSGYI